MSIYHIQYRNMDSTDYEPLNLEENIKPTPKLYKCKICFDIIYKLFIVLCLTIITGYIIYQSDDIREKANNFFNDADDIMKYTIPNETKYFNNILYQHNKSITDIEHKINRDLTSFNIALNRMNNILLGINDNFNNKTFYKKIQNIIDNMEIVAQKMAVLNMTGMQQDLHVIACAVDPMKC